MSEEDELVCSRDGGVLLARLNRPARSNALSLNLLNRLAETAIEAETDPEIRVLVLTGTGEKVFCAGMDLVEFASAQAGDPVNNSSLEVFSRLMYGKLTVPVVAAVNGTAVGGGLEILLGCDVIVAANTAKFGLPEVKRGLFAAGSGTMLGTRIAPGIALEMALTGDTIDSARAYEIGLVNRVVDPADVVAVALEYAGRIAANGPLGLKATKELIRQASVDADGALARATAWQSTVFASEDATEGAMAFIEKRSPVWKAR